MESRTEIFIKIVYLYALKNEKQEKEGLVSVLMRDALIEEKN